MSLDASAAALVEKYGEAAVADAVARAARAATARSMLPWVPIEDVAGLPEDLEMRDGWVLVRQGYVCAHVEWSLGDGDRAMVLDADGEVVFAAAMEDDEGPIEEENLATARTFCLECLADLQVEP